MTTDQRNVAFIDVLLRHNEELRKFIGELIAEMDTLTRKPETPGVNWHEPAPHLRKLT